MAESQADCLMKKWGVSLALMTQSQEGQKQWAWAPSFHLSSLPFCAHDFISIREKGWSHVYRQFHPLSGLRTGSLPVPERKILGKALIGPAWSCDHLWSRKGKEHTVRGETQFPEEGRSCYMTKQTERWAEKWRGSPLLT